MKLKTVLLILLLSRLSFGQASFYSKLSDSALELTKQKVLYDPSYFVIKYPNGDVPSNKGVCTDVIVRAYRKLGVDLQTEIHEDMKVNFSKYPKKWQLKYPDTNIDHRRVPNLMMFFARFGSVKSTTTTAKGLVVRWGI